ncbi:uncharacterized protein LOC143915882 [Arctopsyche grandis]|uniref:uncharacterized protein LOC143915882 n=1 Tax=Arctopsyche grandis TaxID=121162 RepID=UPI00406D64FF
MDAKDVSKEKLKQTISKSKSEEAVSTTVKFQCAKPEKDVRFADVPTEILPEKESKFKESKLLTKLAESSKESSSIETRGGSGSPKVSRKYFTNWRQACDKTKDRTKELLKRWRTLPETDIQDEFGVKELQHDDKTSKNQGWSVHVWTTWVNRYSLDGSDGGDNLNSLDEEEQAALSPLQTEKMTLFFTELLDMDRDDLISEQDFQHFCEKLAHFADWSFNSPEYHILLEVKNEFVESFIDPLPSQYSEKTYWRRLASRLPPGVADINTWLARWPLYLPSCSRFHRLPLFLQYFCKILFGIINKSGSGQISRYELKAFYMSVVGVDAIRCEEIINTAFNLLTSNEYLTLDFETYKRCYSNWLCGKNPNGPGQWILVPPRGPLSIEPYPVDYSALNSDPGRLEKYAPNNKTTRHSVIV